MSNYTKGPWAYRFINDNEFRYEINADNNINNCIANISIINKTNDEAGANARLIAAAPELYEACIFLLLKLNGFIGECKEVTFAEKALNKATT